MITTYYYRDDAKYIHEGEKITNMNDNNNNYNVPPAPQQRMTNNIPPAQPNPAPVATLNLFQKISKLRVLMQQQEIKKSGNNNHLNFQYMELSDFMPVLIRLMDQIGLATVEKITSDSFTLEVIDVDSIEHKTEFIVPFVAASTIKSNIQGIGASITYCRRYSYSGLASIYEPDSLDNTNANTQPIQNTQYNAPVAAPKSVQNNNQQQNQGYNNQQPQQQNNQGPSPYDFQNQQNNNQQYQTKPQPQGSIPWGQLQDGQRTNCPKCGQSAFVNNKVSAKTGKMYWNINCTSCGTKTWRPS